MIKKTSEFPAGTKYVSPGVIRDPNGVVWNKEDDSDDWTADEGKSLSLRYEEQVDRTVRSLFGGGLESDNDLIQVRRLEGRLIWIKGNRGGEKWQELTPELARQIEAGAVVQGQKVIDAEKAEELKAIKIGWYQDTKGDLYQFDGKTWLGNAPSKGQIEKLEYLGN